MEQVLDVYKRPYSEDYPVVCTDESPKQLIKETRLPIPMKPGQEARIDFEYERCGLVNCNNRYLILQIALQLTIDLNGSNIFLASPSF